MIRDKSAKERGELTRQIYRLEMREDGFLSLKKKYEKKLLDFQIDFQQLSNEIEALLLERTLGNPDNYRDMEGARDLNQQVAQYVVQHLLELDEKSSVIRNRLEKEREKLIEERNDLPWE